MAGRGEARLIKWAGLLVVVASGCSRCDAPRPVPDAGPLRIHRSTDLKTAIFSAYPEFRGARVMHGEAELIRVVDRPVAIEGEVFEQVKKNGFVGAIDGGALHATRSPYTLRIDGSKLIVSIPIVEEDIGKLLNTPLAQTTEQIALWYPKLPGATVIDERFHVQLIYDSIAWRSGFLAWQMVDLNTQGSWRVEKYPEGYEKVRRPDGGGGGTPEAYSLAIVDTNTTARIEVQRDGGFVQLDYWLRTEELR
jgi:hypothetical protein